MRALIRWLSVLWLAAAGAALAQAPDCVLLNRSVISANEKGTVHQALAIRDGRIAAAGNTAAIKRLAGKQTRVIDLARRTVIPGLIDSHMHAIRAALSYSTEVDWIGVPTLDEALGRVREAARNARPGQWLIVAGGWTEEQFKERRRPTQAELMAAAPDHPVYVQWMYGWAMLTPLAHQVLKFNAEADLPGGGKFERDAQGNATGTGAHRVANYNPFFALRWMLDGKSAGGLALRGAEETPTRLEALRMYTSGSAWFAHDEAKRGTLEVGKLADLAVLIRDYLAVLNRDYLTVPADQIAALHALLTMVGGRVVYADGPYRQFE